jgi:hypothetical protein
MNDKVTPKLSKADKQEVKRDVKSFKVVDLGYVFSFPDYGATVAVAPATYAHDGSPIPWNKAKFMRFSIAWLGEGDIFRRRTGQAQAMNSFYLDRIQTVPTAIMLQEFGKYSNLDDRRDVKEILQGYFADYVLPTFSHRI